MVALLLFSTVTETWFDAMGYSQALEFALASGMGVGVVLLTTGTVKTWHGGVGIVVGLVIGATLATYFAPKWLIALDYIAIASAWMSVILMHRVLEAK